MAKKTPPNPPRPPNPIILPTEKRPPMNPKVSVVIATYNGSKFLFEQLQSILEQTRQPDQLVICDDCSQDNSLAIATKFAQNAPFDVKVVTNYENLGVIKNFEKGILAATGDLIFLSDQDDFWLPHKIKAYIKIFESNPQVNYIFSDLEVVNEGLQPLNRGLYDAQQKLRAKAYSTVKNLAFEDLISIKTFVNGSTSAFRKSIVHKVCPIPKTTNLHDGWIAMVAAAQGHIGFLPEKFTLYRQHSANVVGYRGFSFFNRVLSALKETPQRKKNEIYALKKLHKRLDNLTNSPTQSLIYIESLNKAKSFTKQKITLLNEQLSTITKSPLKALLILTRHLIKGHYHHNFQALKSYITDLSSALYKVLR